MTNIVDVADAVAKSYTYDAYGNTSSTGTFINSFAYTGAVIDPETGLYYMNARYYDPEAGRFISQDTYRGDGESFWHMYLYCDGEPVNNTDPTGHRIKKRLMNRCGLSFKYYSKKITSTSVKKEIVNNTFLKKYKTFKCKWYKELESHHVGSVVVAMIIVIVHGIMATLNWKKVNLTFYKVKYNGGKEMR